MASSRKVRMLAKQIFFRRMRGSGISRHFAEPPPPRDIHDKAYGAVLKMFFIDHLRFFRKTEHPIIVKGNALIGFKITNLDCVID